MSEMLGNIINGILSPGPGFYSLFHYYQRMWVMSVINCDQNHITGKCFMLTVGLSSKITKPLLNVE